MKIAVWTVVKIWMIFGTPFSLLGPLFLYPSYQVVLPRGMKTWYLTGGR